jgi:ABC-type transporter Mla subunit MlaD
MGVWRSTAVGKRRHGVRRAAFVFALALCLAVAGCGKSGHGAATDSEKAGDVEVLNDLLARELTAAAAYTAGLSRLHGQASALARQLRGQDQEHVDALIKSIRGVGGEADAAAEGLEPPAPRDQAEALTLAYEEEGAALAGALEAAPRLQTPAPSTLAAALAASHAQHLVVLRQALGADRLASVPEPFEPGDLPPPSAAESGRSDGRENSPGSHRPGERG